MILIFSLMINIYISYLILGFGKSQFNFSKIRMNYKQSIQCLSRITNFIQLFQQFWLFNIYNNWQGTNIIYLDGQCKINKFIQISEIYQIIQVSIIQYIIGNEFTIQISKRSEQFQMLITNFISQIQLQNSNDLFITIITWELMNLSQYLLISMQGNTNTGTSQSASIKYFQQSAQTTAFFLIGISLIYSKTGNLNHDYQISIIKLNQFDSNFYTLDNQIQYFGFLMILITFMFKQGAVPFHFWAPDLYDSLSLPILIYIIIIPKITILIFLYSFFIFFNNFITFSFITYIAFFCIIIGSIGLSKQWRIKRFLTYSAISHLGFILLSFLSFSQESYFTYIFIYGIISIVIFYIIQTITINLKGNDDDIVFIKDLVGIFKINPIIAFIFSQSIFSLAGIPPLIGFFLKFQIISGLIDNGKIFYAIIAIIGSVISTFNYLTIIKNINFNISNFQNTFFLKYFSSFFISLCFFFILFGSFYLYSFSFFLNLYFILRNLTNYFFFF